MLLSAKVSSEPMALFSWSVNVGDAASAEFGMGWVSAYVGTVMPAAGTFGFGGCLGADKEAIGVGRGDGDISSDKEEAEFFGEWLPAGGSVGSGSDGDFCF